MSLEIGSRETNSRTMLAAMQLNSARVRKSSSLMYIFHCSQAKGKAVRRRIIVNPMDPEMQARQQRWISISCATILPRWNIPTPQTVSRRIGMETYIVNGCEVEFDIFDLTNLELFESERNFAMKRAEEMQAGVTDGNALETLHEMCEIVRGLFRCRAGRGIPIKFWRSEETS